MASKRETGVIAGVGLATVLALGGYKAISDYSKDTFGDEHAIFDYGIQLISQNECITKVPFPKDDEIIVFSSEGVSEEETLPDTDGYRDPLPHSYVANLADQHSLTVYDNSEAIDVINNSDSLGGVIDGINTFTQNFQMQVAIPGNDEYEDANKYTPFKSDEFDLDDFKSQGISLTDFFSTIPQETFHLGSMRRLNIVHENSFEGFGTELISNKSPDSYYNPYTDNMYIELNSDDPQWQLRGAFNVSASSAIDIGVCGLLGAQVDNVFTNMSEEVKQGLTTDDNPEIIENFEEQLRIISEKGILMGRFLTPGPSNPISGATLEDRNKVWLQILRINEHVPGYADFWKKLTLEYSGPILEEIIIDNTEETTA